MKYTYRLQHHEQYVGLVSFCAYISCVVGVTALLSLNDITQSISTINSMNYPRVRVIHPQMSIEVPVELLQIFGGRDIRTASFLYFNVENLFPNGEDK